MLTWVHWTAIYVVISWTIRIAALISVPQRRDATAARTWLLFILFLPLLGGAVYLVIGRIRLPEWRRIATMEATDAMRLRIGAAVAASGVAYTPSGEATGPAELARRLGEFPAVAGNRIEPLPDYLEAIARLEAAIDGATAHVHLLYYIFADDEVGRRIASALERAAQRGVRCRVILDAIGAKSGLRGLGPALRRAGVEVTEALPPSLWRSRGARVDLRNHRKIAVIDGREGFTGSQNVVEPTFIPGVPNRELMVRVTGPVVAQLQAAFLMDREVETRERLDDPTLFPPLARVGSSPAQVLPSGPGYATENQRGFFVTLLYAAQRRVVLTTPYFVPDDIFIEAMCDTARRGVQVDLVVSLHNNQRFAQLAEQSYYSELLAAGVRIHRHRPRFLHAKQLMVDTSVAVVGSANLDIRSFALNEELSLIIYDHPTVTMLTDLADGYIADSDTVTTRSWSRQPPQRRFVQNLCRLGNSLL